MGAGNSKEQKPLHESIKSNNVSTNPAPIKGEDYSKPSNHSTLPKELQDLVDRDDSTWETIYEGQYVHIPLFSQPAAHNNSQVASNQQIPMSAMPHMQLVSAQS